MHKHKPLLRISDLTHVQSQNFFEITYDGHRKGGSLLQACAFPELIIDNATPFAGYGGSELYVGMLINHAKHHKLPPCRRSGESPCPSDLVAIRPTRLIPDIA